MEKIILSIILTVSTTIVYAQSEKATKIAKYIETYSMPVTNSEGNCIVKYNSEVKALTIDDYRLLLNNVSILIEYYEGYYFVAFNCKSGNNCIKDPNGILRLAFSIPFANKKRCEEFISLINSL